MVTISLRVHEDTKELYEELKDNRTADNFLATLLEIYQNPKKVEVPAKADKEKIEELTKQVKTLLAENEALKEAKTDVLGHFDNQTFEFDSLKAEVDANVLFHLKDGDNDILNWRRDKELKERGKEINREQALYLTIRDRQLRR